MNDRAGDKLVMRVRAQALRDAAIACWPYDNLKPRPGGEDYVFWKLRQQFEAYAKDVERAASLSAQETKGGRLDCPHCRGTGCGGIDDLPCRYCGGSGHKDDILDRPEMGGERAIYQDGSRTGGAGDSTFSGKQRTAVDGAHGQANADLPNGPRLPPDAPVQDELKPCPFCGATAVTECTIQDGAVHCTSCRAKIVMRHVWKDSRMDDVIAAWNRRLSDNVGAPSPAPTEQPGHPLAAQLRNFATSHPAYKDAEELSRAAADALDCQSIQISVFGQEIVKAERALSALQQRFDLELDEYAKQHDLRVANDRAEIAERDLAAAKAELERRKEQQRDLTERASKLQQQGEAAERLLCDEPALWDRYKLARASISPDTAEGGG